MSAMDQMLTNMTVSSTGVVDTPIFSITMIIFLIILLAGIIYAVFKMYENKKPPVESIVLIAVLTAIATVGRIILMSIPAVNMASFIIIMVGIIHHYNGWCCIRQGGRFPCWCIDCFCIRSLYGNGILGLVPDACLGTYGSKCRNSRFQI